MLKNPNLKQFEKIVNAYKYRMLDNERIDFVDAARFSSVRYIAEKIEKERETFNKEPMFKIGK